jgi:N-acyl-D-aspartate/D-glutamate deacylase
MTPAVLLENARIVDGTGAPWFRGSVAVTDGWIETVERGHEYGRSANESVDLDGSVLAPGFVDFHVHSDLRLFEEPTLPAMLRQGVTTEVLGQDGFSMARSTAREVPPSGRSTSPRSTGSPSASRRGGSRATTSTPSTGRGPPRTSGRS